LAIWKGRHLARIHFFAFQNCLQRFPEIVEHSLYANHADWRGCGEGRTCDGDLDVTGRGDVACTSFCVRFKGLTVRGVIFETSSSPFKHIDTIEHSVVGHGLGGLVCWIEGRLRGWSKGGLLGRWRCRSSRRLSRLDGRLRGCRCDSWQCSRLRGWR
jgi:hypothetical protein